MTRLTPVRLADFVDRCASALQAAEASLNEADARLGDGDTGGMLSRYSAALADAGAGAEADLGAAFGRLAAAGSGSTGSSFGTLLTTGLITMARETKGKNAIEWREVAGLIGQARDAMLVRGRTALGSKTALDAIDYIVAALAESDTPEAALLAAHNATSKALRDFRDQPSKTGRAGMFRDRSVGLDDPGMIAIDIIANAATPSEA